MILQGNVSPITRTAYLTSGFLNFWRSGYGSRTYCRLNFRRDGIERKRGCRNTSDRILKWWGRFFPHALSQKCVWLISHFSFFVFLKSKKLASQKAIILVADFSISSFQNSRTSISSFKKSISSRYRSIRSDGCYTWAAGFSHKSKYKAAFTLLHSTKSQCSRLVASNDSWRSRLSRLRPEPRRLRLKPIRFQRMNTPK